MRSRADCGWLLELSCALLKWWPIGVGRLVLVLVRALELVLVWVLEWLLSVHGPCLHELWAGKVRRALQVACCLWHTHGMVFVDGGRDDRHVGSLHGGHGGRRPIVFKDWLVSTPATTPTTARII